MATMKLVTLVLVAITQVQGYNREVDSSQEVCLNNKIYITTNNAIRRNAGVVLSTGTKGLHG